jgi:hypothetical protein
MTRRSKVVVPGCEGESRGNTVGVVVMGMVVLVRWVKR